MKAKKPATVQMLVTVPRLPELTLTEQRKGVRDTLKQSGDYYGRAVRVGHVPASSDPAQLLRELVRCQRALSGAQTTTKYEQAEVEHACAWNAVTRFADGVAPTPAPTPQRHGCTYPNCTCKVNWDTWEGCEAGAKEPPAHGVAPTDSQTIRDQTFSPGKRQGE